MAFLYNKINKLCNTLQKILERNLYFLNLMRLVEYKDSMQFLYNNTTKILFKIITPFCRQRLF